ncbi:hypothetical protein FNV43_RR00413 [Rhamnella rubrinervis]|uniref:Uncharacterized protein n=1 Tax=Rhamnella rubrinervis TaxID=2594499 RepID=A0A8K0HNI7_9ROSA|nr:hypothetical protein FNV43_RR00413 [Rhamnella rubrinervis]
MAFDPSWETGGTLPSSHSNSSACEHVNEKASAAPSLAAVVSENASGMSAPQTNGGAPPSFAAVVRGNDSTTGSSYAAAILSGNSVPAPVILDNQNVPIRKDSFRSCKRTSVGGCRMIQRVPPMASLEEKGKDNSKALLESGGPSFLLHWIQVGGNLWSTCAENPQRPPLYEVKCHRILESPRPPVWKLRTSMLGPRLRKHRRPPAGAGLKYLRRPHVRMKGAVEVLLFTLHCLDFSGSGGGCEVCSLLILMELSSQGGVGPGYVKQTSIGLYDSCLEVWNSVSCCTLAIAFDHHRLLSLSKLELFDNQFGFIEKCGGRIAIACCVNHLVIKFSCNVALKIDIHEAFDFYDFLAVFISDGTGALSSRFPPEELLFHFASFMRMACSYTLICLEDFHSSPSILAWLLQAVFLDGVLIRRDSPWPQNHENLWYDLETVSPLLDLPLILLFGICRGAYESVGCIEADHGGVLKSSRGFMRVSLEIWWDHLYGGVDSTTSSTCSASRGGSQVDYKSRWVSCLLYVSALIRVSHLEGRNTVRGSFYRRCGFFLSRWWWGLRFLYPHAFTGNVNGFANYRFRK